MTQLLVLLAACLAMTSCSVVRRDAPPAATPLQELQHHAAEFEKTFSAQFSQLTNSKNTKEFNDAVHSGTDAVLKQFSEFSQTLQNVLSDANGKTKEALESARTNIEKTVVELRAAHPEVEQQASALKDKLQQAVQNTVQETQKLAKEVASNMEETNKKLEPQIKKAYDDFVKIAEDVQKKLHDVANKQ